MMGLFRIISTLWIALFISGAVAAPPNAVEPAVLDIASCRVIKAGQAQPMEEAAVLDLLGLVAKPDENARFARRKNQKAAETVQYLIAFQKPTALGTIVGGTGELRILKPNAPFPPDVHREADWQTIEVQAGQSDPRVAPLPPKTVTRAILVTVAIPMETLPGLSLLVPRFANQTPFAVANADTEYTTEADLTANVTFHASNLTEGKGWWVNSGKNSSGVNPRAPISDVAPAWFVLSWPEKRLISGVILRDNFLAFELQTYVGPAGINATAATEAEWRTIRKFDQFVWDEERWMTFEPIETRALRVKISKTNEGAVARVKGFHTLSDLGDKPVVVVTAATQEEPPFAISYDLAASGKVTMVVDRPDGTRVRNIIANAPRESGANSEPWNLKDENGKYVAPGKYKWRAITHPPLELRYEMTAYPNVTTLFPERPAWLTGHSGSAGWLADHAAPSSACSTGDRVFIGASVVESGVGLVECDLEGRKLWGHHSFAGFTACGMLATDGKTLFNVRESRQPGMEEGTEAIWGVDLATRDIRTIAYLQPTAERKRGVQGIAARDNKIYLAVHSPDTWLNNAVAVTDVDLANCLPTYPPARPSRGGEIVVDQRADFLRLLRLTGTPPGQAASSLTTLETTKDPGSQQYVMVAFNKPMAIGSLVFPPPPTEDMVQFQVAILKPGAAYPPRVKERSDWEIVPITDKSPWAVIPLPPGTETQAVRFTFTRGGADAGADDDLLAEVEDKGDGPSLDLIDGPGPKKPETLGMDKSSWERQIEGLKILSRRFENLLPTAQIHVNSGKIAPDGTWDAKRTEAISALEPAIYAMEWKTPQSLRGLAIKEIDGAVTEIDAYTGPAGAKIDPNGTEGWEKIATYEQALRYYYHPDVRHNSHARYMDGYVDFGRNVETRALRLRVVKQWDKKEAYPFGVRFDQGDTTLDLKRCRIYGVAPLKYLGGEPPNDPMVGERLEVLDAGTGKVVQEFPLPGNGSPEGGAPRGNILAFNGSGDLFALAQEKVMKVDLKSGDTKTIVTDLIKPGALACDKAGNFYVFDAAPERRNIRVYDPAGKFQREIGEPGGHQLGPWNVNRLENVTALAVDNQNQVWAVENTIWPKRVSMWTSEGKFLKELLGPTSYGGGGAVDPANRNRLFYGALEFELDWEKGTTRLKNLTSAGDSKICDIPVNVNNRLYLTNVRAGDFGTPSAAICLYEDGRAKMVAGLGIASDFSQLREPEITKALGGKILADYICAWSDLNGDGKAQLEEVQLWPKPKDWAAVTFDSKLNAQLGSISFPVKTWLPNGVPVYQRVDGPNPWGGLTIRLENGSLYRFEDFSSENKIAGVKSDGTPIWTYPTEGPGVHALTTSKPLYDGQIVCELGLAGHAVAQKGDLGEFVAFNTNTGVINIITADGLFAGQIFSDMRSANAQPWTQPETARGMKLDGVTLGQEHFGAYLCRTMDDRFYVVAGHNHASIVEVIGMDRFKRFEGEITVTAADLAKVQAWESAQIARKVYARSPVIDAYRVTTPPKLDGKLNDWPAASAKIDNPKAGEIASFHVGYDDQYLYVAYDVRGHGPLKNQGKQWDRLFKSGASVDLQIGLDPKAPADRTIPAAGDQRLLLTFMGDEPAAVLYQAVVPGTPPDKAWQVASPIKTIAFDQVKRLEKVMMFSSGDDGHYVLEAAIPLAELGLKITPDLRLKLDWGILTSGPEGSEVLQRLYWANKFTHITADAPSEAELHPNMWGHIRFHGATVDAQLDPGTQKSDAGVNELLDELK